MRPFREHHILQILDRFDKELSSNRSIPLDLFLKTHFRKNKAIGSNDRKSIADSIYGIMRWKGLLDHLANSGEASWEERVALYQRISPKTFLEQTAIPPHIRVSFPHWLFSLLEKRLSTQEAIALCTTCNEKAPFTIRANGLKTSREALLEKLGKKWSVSPCVHAPFGITFSEHVHFSSIPLYQQGLFEVQDEGSQLIAELIQASPKGHVLDYCAGSGGKSLAIAPKMQGRGQLFLHDIRPRILQQAKERLRRAGVQHVQFLSPAHMRRWTSKMDWVLVDVPCSGTGTLRRNPERKWWLHQELLHQFIQKQREIFKEAYSFLKPGGHIVYATCSILAEENEEQARWFEAHFPLERIGTPFSSFPQSGGMDGFFGIVWKDKSDYYRQRCSF